MNPPKPFWHLHLYQKVEGRGLNAEAPNAPQVSNFLLFIRLDEELDAEQETLMD